jgi:hypothetical protein
MTHVSYLLFRLLVPTNRKPYTGWQSQTFVQIDSNSYSSAGTHLAKSAHLGFRRLLLTPLGRAVLPLVGWYESG